METNRATAGKIIIGVILISPFFMGVSTYARSFQEYNGVMLAESGYIDSSEGRGRRAAGPPPEAIDACEGLGESEACDFTSPRGDEISGTCEYVPGDMFACVPESGPPPGGRRPSEDAPPPE